MSARHQGADCPARAAHRRSIWKRILRAEPDCYHYDDICGPEFVRPGVCVVGVLSAIVALIAGGLIGGTAVARGFSERGCREYGEQTDREVRWVDATFFDYGCYVRWNDTWIERDAYTRITFGQEAGSEATT